MGGIDICKLDTSALDPDTGLPTVRATSPIVGETDENDVEEFGLIDSMQCLGVTALPATADDTGHAEGAVARNAGNTDGLVLGARDARCTGVYGNLKAGDSCLHSTDPAASAQFQAKASRIACIATKDGDGNTMLLALDGKNDKVQIAAFGGIVEMTKDKITITSPSGGCSIMMQDDTIILAGKVILGGIGPVLLNIPSGTQANIVAVPPVLLPAPNVYVSAT